MKINILLVGLLLMLSATSVLANGPYVGVGGGLSILHKSDFNSVGDPTHTVSYDTGYGINASLGYNMKPIRVELEFGYKRADLDKIDGPLLSGQFINSDVTVMSYMLNSYFDINTETAFSPYIGAGVGMLDGEVDFNGNKIDDTVIGYQFAVGVSYNFNKNVALDVSYRYQGSASDFKQDGGGMSYESSNVMGGLRYSF